jgi:hypothetical protein
MQRFALLAGICAVCLAACGSSSKPSKSGGGAPAHGQFLAFSQCMRSHGVANFPDPPSGGGIRITPSMRINPAAPAFQSAQHACKHLLPGGGPPTHPSAAEEATLVKLAECMRAHGITNFPDPTFVGGNGLPSGRPALIINGYEFKLGPGVGPQSPAFQHAMNACGGPGGA